MLDIRESRSLYVHIYMFCVIFSDFYLSVYFTFFFARDPIEYE